MELESVIDFKVYYFSNNGREDMIYIQRSEVDSIVSVGCSWDDGWFYDFYEEDGSAFTNLCNDIVEFISVCHTREEVIDALDEVFMDDYEDVLVYECDCCCECEGCCC